MTAPGLTAQHREALAGILRGWMDAREERPLPGPRLQRVLLRYQYDDPTNVEDDLRNVELPQGGAAVDLPRYGRVMQGPAIEQAFLMHPIGRIRMQVDDSGALVVSLRFALFYEHDGTYGCVGWRYETADAPGAMHPFLHAQSVMGWSPGVSLYSPNPERDDSYGDPPIPVVNETRPAFPLPGSCVPSLAVAMMASFYGAPGATPWVAAGLRGVTTPQNVMRELQAILPGLQG